MIDVECVVDDANDVVEGDDNNGRDDAVNEWDDALELGWPTRSWR